MSRRQEAKSDESDPSDPFPRPPPALNQRALLSTPEMTPQKKQLQILWPFDPHSHTEKDVVDGFYEEEHRFWPRYDEDGKYDQSAVFNFPILPSHVLCQQWKQVCMRIMADLEAAELEYSSIDLFFRGQLVDGRHHLTVLIYTPILFEQTWETVGRDIYRNHIQPLTILAKEEVFLEFKIGRIVRQAGMIKCGDSISQVGQEETGTLGGFLKCIHNGNTQIAALTCHHVLSRDISALGSILDQSATIHSPGSQVIHENREQIQQTIEESEFQVSEVAVPRIKDYEMIGDGEKAQMWRKRLDEQLATQEHFKDMSTKWPNVPVKIGEIFATSGLRTTGDGENKHYLDWALITNLTDDVCTENRIKDSMRSHPGSGIKHKIPFGEDCVKFGQKTGFTRGIVNGVEGVIVDPERFPKLKTWEVTIVSAPRYRSQVFSDFGDSGAFVYQFPSMDLIGINFCGAGDGSSSKMTPISSILDDARKQFGIDLSWVDE